MKPDTSMSRERAFETLYGLPAAIKANLTLALAAIGSRLYPNALNI